MKNLQENWEDFGINHFTVSCTCQPTNKQFTPFSPVVPYDRDYKWPARILRVDISVENEESVLKCCCSVYAKNENDLRNSAKTTQAIEMRWSSIHLSILDNSPRIHPDLRAINICCPGGVCRNENEPFIAKRAKIVRLKNINSISFCNSITKKKRTHFARELLWCKVDFNIKLVFLFIAKLNFKWIVPCYLFGTHFISFSFHFINFFFAIRFFAVLLTLSLRVAIGILNVWKNVLYLHICVVKTVKTNSIK